MPSADLVPVLDAVLLQSFVAVAEARSFTKAARSLGLGQSTVSQHITKLEHQVGRKLIVRDTHSVCTTPDGDAVLPFALQALKANAKICAYLSGADLRGRIRLGASEDFVFSALPRVLSEFTSRYSAVDLELTVGLSETLYELYDSGQLDLIFAKRREGDLRGRLAWVDDLVWIGGPDILLEEGGPIPLVVFPPPSMTRQRALDVLEKAGQRWRVVCTSGSLSGLRAAAIAGLGIVAHAAQLIPPGLTRLAANPNLPSLGQIEFVVVGPGKTHKAATALAEVILSSTGRIKRGMSDFN